LYKFLVTFVYIDPRGSIPGESHISYILDSQSEKPTPDDLESWSNYFYKEFSETEETMWMCIVSFNQLHEEKIEKKQNLSQRIKKKVLELVRAF